MVMSSAMAATAAESVESASDSAAESADTATVGDDVEIKKALEDAISNFVDDEGSFEPEKMKGLIGTLFGAPKGEAPEEHIKEAGSVMDYFAPIEEAIDLHNLEETADILEPGDETIFSHVIVTSDFHEDDTIHMLGYFTIVNFDKDKDCSDDLVEKNGESRVELVTLVRNEDGTYEVPECITVEEGDTDKIKQVCEDIDTEPDSFYEALAMSDLTYACDLHDFMEAHPEYDHIEYSGEMVTLDDLHNIIDEEFASYLNLYAIDAGLTEES